MKNIYSDFNSTFCLLQQIAIDKNDKYFIFGIKFDYIYIPEIQNTNNKIKIFIIEKTYLFISSELLCKLFENAFRFISEYKKLIFLKYIMDYNSLKNKEKIKTFNELNKENVRNTFFIFKIIIYKYR